ncbi:hypothetical protein, conserved [Leishmania tarentolae]|uniref:Uncharacterized protein n=1 Tax=Leishmania tarentolae TaxID=5689 RepID=A0A640KQM0_LEITA|nr:hypothetical protein, conserved [Leishmania tarentolae]
MQSSGRRGLCPANVTDLTCTSSVSSRKLNISQLVSPSRLCYVGDGLTKRASPRSLLRGVSVTKLREPSSSQYIRDSPSHPEVLNTLPVNHQSCSTTLPSSVHPLLQQALLLIESAEVGERLAFSQEEMDAFDSIITLLSVAKEVEAIRVAAFEMFHIERASRRTLKRQERHERKILRLWYSESYEDALLTEEVQIIRQQSEESRNFFSRSPSRSRSTSLQKKSHELFYMATPQNGSPWLTQAPCSQKRDKTAHMASFSLSASGKQEDIRGPSPTVNCDEVRDNSPEVLPLMPLEQYFLHNVGSSCLLHRSNDSVNASDRQQHYYECGNHYPRTLGSIEADLEDRIARQMVLLLPGRQSYQK